MINEKNKWGWRSQWYWGEDDFLRWKWWWACETAFKALGVGQQRTYTWKRIKERIDPLVLSMLWLRQKVEEKRLDKSICSLHP